MIPLSRLAPLALAIMALAACGDSSETGGQAAGSKILEGSISDSMIPYEKLRSEAPPAKIKTDEGGASGGNRTGPDANPGGPETSALPEGTTETDEPPATSPPDD